MMRSLLWLVSCTLAVSVYGQTNILDIECPFPEGQNVDVEDHCNKYGACEFTDGVCHLKNNEAAGYTRVSDIMDTGRGFKFDIAKADMANTMFDSDISKLVFEVIYHESYHVQVKIYDPETPRYEVPIPLSLPEAADEERDYEVVISDLDKPLVFRVVRNSTGTEIFKSAGPLVFEDQFIQFTTQLSSEYFYGLGENPHTSLKHSFESRPTYPMFARDQPVGPLEMNEYGVHPYYMNIEDDDGNTHTLFFLNSNAMEYQTFLMGDDKNPAVTFRTIGGIIDLHLFLGPTPEEANSQFTNMIGNPFFPPYWSLGFQLSRWGYNSTANVRALRERMKEIGIPQDVQTFDIEYLYRKRDFTYDTENGFEDLPELIEELHNDNLKVTLILDPALVIDWDNYEPSERGRANDVFVKWMSPDLIPEDQEPGCGDYVVGYVWPDTKTVFPDFFNPATQEWWKNELIILHETLKYDSIWIDMNEPANFGTNLDRPWNYPDGEPNWSLKCPFNHLDSPVYPTKATWMDINDCKRISDKTICMSTIHSDGNQTFLHYDVHNLYGWSETIATYKGLEALDATKRPVVLSRSTYSSSGKYAVHWLGDNTANWQQLHMSVIGMIEFNMFGMSMVGADICGFFDEPDEELCARWMQVGAFYPFSRNHNTIGTLDQDPAIWPIVGEISREVLSLRYRLLPHLYTLFHVVHMHGGTIIRPLFSLDPSDKMAREVDDQFLWNHGIMVAPVITQGAESRNIYFPKGLWYELVSGKLAATGPMEITDFSAPLEVIPVFVRGGEILPMQEPALTTVESRTNPFELLVALEDNMASGRMFWDSGDGYEEMMNSHMAMYTYDNGNFTSRIMHGNSATEGLSYETIKILGLSTEPTSITVGGIELDPSSWLYSASEMILELSVSLDATMEFAILIT